MPKLANNNWSRVRLLAITTVFVLISLRNITRFPYHKDDDQAFRWLGSYSFEDTEKREESLSYVQSFKRLNRVLEFLHIPKTAGTTIEQLIAAGQAQIPWGVCRFPSRPPHLCHGTIPNWFLGNETGAFIQSPRKVETSTVVTTTQSSLLRPHLRPPPWIGLPSHWHVLPHLFHPYDNPYDNFDVFSVIRDPVDRALSEYHYQRVVLRFTNLTKMGPTSFYERKLKALHENSRRMAKYTMDDGHYIPQHEYILRPLEVRQVDFVLTYDLDTMGYDFDQLVSAFGLPMQWPGHGHRAMASNRSHHDNNNALVGTSASTVLSAHMQEQVKSYVADDYKWFSFQ